MFKYYFGRRWHISRDLMAHIRFRICRHIYASVCVLISSFFFVFFLNFLCIVIVSWIFSLIRDSCGPSCSPETNDRGLKLLDFATYNNLVLANTLGNHKPSRRWTWHSPDGTHHNQIDYILVKKRFRSGIKTARTRTFPGADVGSDHDMVMMTFQTRLKNSRKPTQPRVRFDLEKLNDPIVMSAFQATIGGSFHLLLRW